MKSRIFTFLIVLFLIGVSLQKYILLEETYSFFIAGIFLVSSIFAIKNKIIFTIIASIGCLFVGVTVSMLQEQKYLELNTSYSKKDQEIVAVVDDLPTVSEFGQVVRLRAQKIDGQEVSGLIFLGYLRQSAEYREIISFQAKPAEYKEDKIGRLIKQKVAAEIYVNKYEVIGRENKLTLKSCLLGIRQRLNESISRSLPSEEAKLASGLILGEKALITAETKRYLQAGGLSHIIALSGYNITILLGMFAFIKNKASRVVNLLVPAVFIFSFVLMTGGSASIVRAGIMGFMPILAKFLYRQKNSFVAIMFSAFLMVLFNPFVLLYDVGFQLSFAAMFGLSYLSPLIMGLFKNDNFALNLLSETLGAQIAVLPLLIFYFGQVSIISPISNLVILSFVPLGMLVSFLVGLFGALNSTLGTLFALPSYVLLKLINVLIVFFGDFSFSSIQIKTENSLWLLVMYLVIINFYTLLRKGSSART